MVRALRFILALCFLSAPVAGQVDQARDDYDYAAGLYDRGLFDRAQRAFAGFVRQWPGDQRLGAAHYYLGECLTELGQDDEALEAFEAGCGGGGHVQERACFRAGELLLARGDGAAALERFTALTRRALAPELAEPTRYFLAEAAAASGDPALAAQAYHELLEAFPRGRYAGYAHSALGFLLLDAGDAEAALVQFTQGAAAGVGDAELVAESHVMQGECALRLERWQEARAAFQAALGTHEESFSLPGQLGLARAQLGAGRTADALAQLARLAEAHPTDESLRAALLRDAATQGERGDSATGLELLELIGEPEGQLAADVAYWRGVLQSQDGEAAAAIESLRRGAAGNPQRQYRLGDALARAGRHEEAVQVFGALRRKASDEVLRHEATFAEAYSLHRLGHAERALPLLESLDADGVAASLREDAVFALAENLFALERHEEALRIYRSVCESGGAHAVEAIYKGGWCEHLLQQYERSIRSFRTLLESPGGESFHADATYLIGKGHEALGQSEEAAAVFSSLAESTSGPTATRALLASAALARGSGDVSAAASAYERAATSATAGKDLAGLGEALFGLAETHTIRGRHGEALAALDRLLADCAEHPRVLAATLARGWSLHELGRHADAIRAVAELVKRGSPELAGEGVFLIGLCARAMDDRAGVISSMQELLRRWPDHARAAEAELVLGVTVARSGRQEEAAAILSAYLERTEDLAGRDTAMYELAFCRQASGDADGFARQLEAVVAAGGKAGLRADAGFRLGEAAYDAGDWQAAHQHYERAASAAGESEGDAATPPADLRAKALYKAGWCQRHLGEHVQAAARFSEVFATGSPLAAEAGYLAAEDREAAGDVEGALAGYEEMSRRYSQHELAADADLRAILCLASLGRHEEVIRRAPGALERHPDHALGLEVGSALGDAFLARSQWGRARTAHGEITGRSEGPLAARAQFQIGEAHRLEGNPDLAIDAYLKVTILYAHAEWSARATLAAADLFRASGQQAKARRLYEELLRDHAGRPEAKAAAARLEEDE